MKSMVFYLSLKDTWKFDRNGQVGSTGTARVETKKAQCIWQNGKFQMDWSQMATNYGAKTRSQWLGLSV